MNSTNCILFVVITYLSTYILAWNIPPQYVTLATFVPSTVAILLTVYNKQKVRDLFKLSSLKNCSLGFIILVVAFILYICLLLIITWLGFSFLNVEWTLEKVKDASIAMILFSLLMIFAMLIVTSLGEEIGWRAYLLKNLKTQIPNFYIRALIVGLIWAIWHIPIWKAVSSSFLEDGLTFRVLVFYILFICAMSIIFTWLFEKDNSVWPVTIAHATNNFITQYISILFTTIPIPMPNYVTVISYTLLTAAYFTVAIGIIWFEKYRGRGIHEIY